MKFLYTRRKFPWPVWQWAAWNGLCEWYRGRNISNVSGNGRIVTFTGSLIFSRVTITQPWRTLLIFNSLKEKIIIVILLSISLIKNKKFIFNPPPKKKAAVEELQQTMGFFCLLVRLLLPDCRPMNDTNVIIPLNSYSKCHTLNLKLFPPALLMLSPNDWISHVYMYMLINYSM